MREAIEDVVENVLRPLLQVDASDVELVEVADTRVVLRLSGEAAFGAGAHYIRNHVVEPAVRNAAGRPVEVVFERSVPNATVTFGSTTATTLPDDAAAALRAALGVESEDADAEAVSKADAGSEAEDVSEADAVSEADDVSEADAAEPTLDDGAS